MPSPLCRTAARACGTKRRFCRLPRLSGIPQSRFAGAYACPPCVARAFSGPKRDGEHRESGAVRGRGKMRPSGAALRENRKKDCPLVPGGFCRRAQRRFCARFGQLRLLAGKHVCVPTAPLGCRCGKPAKRDFPPVRGGPAGRLRAVDRGLRNSSADGGHGMRRVMKKYGLSSRAVRFFPIVRRAVSLGLHNITNEMKNRTVLRLPFDRLGGGLRV